MKKAKMKTSLILWLTGIMLVAGSLHAQTAVQYTNGDIFYTRDLQLKPDQIQFKPIGAENQEYVIVPMSQVANIKFTDGSMMDLHPVIPPPKAQQESTQALMPTDTMLHIITDALVEHNAQMQQMLSKANDSLRLLLLKQAQATKTYQEADLLMMQTQVNLLTRQTLLLDSVLNQLSNDFRMATNEEDPGAWVMPKTSISMQILSRPKFEDLQNDPAVVEYQTTPRIGQLMGVNFNNAARTFRFQFAFGYLIESQRDNADNREANSELIFGVSFLGLKSFGKSCVYSGARLDYTGRFVFGAESHYLAPGFVTGGEYALSNHFTIGAELTQFAYVKLNPENDASEITYYVQPRLSVAWYF